MDKMNKILSGIKQNNFLNMAIELGINPQEVKEVVIETLSPYFEDREILVNYSINLLIPQFLNIIKLKKDTLLLETFEKCLDIYRKAKNKDQLKCFELMAFWLNDIEECISRFWTIYSLEQDKSILQNEEMVFECFRNIGDIIEGLSKPFLKSLLSQKKLIDENHVNLSQLNHYDLGKIVDELIKHTNCQQLFMPLPWSIRLSHWRNIAYHHNYKLKEKNIICWYGKGIKKNKFTIHKNEILMINRKVSDCFIVLKLAYDIFFIDNTNNIEKFLLNGKLNIRFEALFIIIAAGIASQGFEILDFEKNSENAKIIVKDMTNLDPLERSVHASQFLYSLWLVTKSENMRVEYWERDGNPKYSFETRSDICELIYNGDKDFCELANKMKIINL
jgi:hypothetical protein